MAALTAEGTIAISQFARLSTLVVRVAFATVDQGLIQVQETRMLRFVAYCIHVAVFAGGQAGDTQHGLQQNGECQHHRQVPFSSIDARKIHRLGAESVLLRIARTASQTLQAP
ncbi:MAG TPA: hypothetical protein VJ908_05515 [Wenzhouxiangellaceae bacterium]|nr:hypothetical protein [Wenzhouxiangellaceae bacterium]